MLTEREDNTRKSYDVSAENWLEHSGGRDRLTFWPEGMYQFIEKLQGDGVVLEVGCGPATDGKYLEKVGAIVLSTDYSSTMLKIAKELNPEGLFTQMDMQDLGLKDNMFNGFWATACIFHLENPNKALKELVRVTKNGGVGFITIKEGKGDEVSPKTGYYFKYYQGAEFEEILTRNSLETLSSERKAGTPNHDFLTYLVRVTK